MKSSKKVVRRERRTFSAEFKAEAVRLMTERRAAGGTLAQVSRELDVRADQLRAWARQARDRTGSEATVPRRDAGAGEPTAPARTRGRTARASIRKKSGGVLRERVAMRCAVIARHRDEFPVRLMCRVLDVSVSGFYAYLQRPLSWRRVIDEILMAHVRIAFAASGDTYGAPRVLQERQAKGLPTSQKRVARLICARDARPERAVQSSSPRRNSACSSSSCV